jgi:hypothetical protein
MSRIINTWALPRLWARQLANPIYKGVIALFRHCEEQSDVSMLWIASLEPVIGRAFARPVGSQ